MGIITEAFSNADRRDSPPRIAARELIAYLWNRPLDKKATKSKLPQCRD